MTPPQATDRHRAAVPRTVDAAPTVATFATAAAAVAGYREPDWVEVYRAAPVQGKGVIMTWQGSHPERVQRTIQPVPAKPARTLLDKIGATEEEIAAACTLFNLARGVARKGDVASAVEMLRESRAKAAADAAESERKAADRAARAEKKRLKVEALERHAWAEQAAAGRRRLIREWSEIGQHPTASRGDFLDDYCRLMLAAAEEKLAKHSQEPDVVAALALGAGTVQGVTLFYGVAEYGTIEVLATSINLSGREADGERGMLYFWIDAEDCYLWAGQAGRRDALRWANACARRYGIKHERRMVPALTDRGREWVLHHSGPVKVGPLGETLVRSEVAHRARLDNLGVGRVAS